MLDKEEIIKRLLDRVEGYESSDKTAFIEDLLPCVDTYVLIAMCKQLNIDYDSQ